MLGNPVDLPLTVLLLVLYGEACAVPFVSHFVVPALSHVVFPET